MKGEEEGGKEQEEEGPLAILLKINLSSLFPSPYLSFQY